MRLDAIEREGELNVHRMLAPERAVIVEDRDPLRSWTKSGEPGLVTRSTKFTMADLVWPSFQDG